MPLRKYIFRPGINREGTNYSNEGGWYDSDKIRFRKGRPERIGGWRKNSSNSFIGTCRNIHIYRNISQTNYQVLGTHQKLYLKEGIGFNDITPIRATTTNGITFSATNGSSTITATDDDHGAIVGDFVTISGAATLGGLITADVLNQEYQIISVTTDTYTFTAKDTDGDTVTANSSDSGNGGAGVDGVYQINTGLDTYLKSTGWGVGTWGASTFGSASAISATNQLRLWSSDNFGDDAIACVRGGGIYYWDESSGTDTRAIPFSSLSGASDTPTLALQIMMSEVDRHIICFGSNAVGSSTIEPLLVRWSDTENAADWTPTATNQAGGVKLSAGSSIIGALKTRQEILIWTDIGITSMRFVGQPFIFTFNEVAKGPSMISPNACVNANNSVYFMDRGGFYTYTGSAQRLPCTVLDYIFTDINLEQLYKVFAAANEDNNEVMFFYPSSSSDEIDRYVIYNYLEQVWSIGTTEDNFARTAWNVALTLDYPIAAGKIDTSNLNYLYDHELGYSSDGSAFTSYIESSDFDLDPDGEKFMFISKLIPDIEFRNQTSTSNEVTINIKGRNYPLQSLSTLSTISVTPESTFSNTRARSRQCAIRVSSDNLDYGWRLGDLRLEIRPDGKR
jgi:hypothetical protein